MKIKTKILKPKAVLFKTFILKETTKDFLFTYKNYTYYPLPKTRISLIKRKYGNAICFPDDVAIYDTRCLIIQVTKNIFLSYSYSPDFHLASVVEAKLNDRYLGKTAKNLLAKQNNKNDYCDVYGQIIEFNLVIK